jgi:hypothetical protein
MSFHDFQVGENLKSEDFLLFQLSIIFFLKITRIGRETQKLPVPYHDHTGIELETIP